MSDEKIDWSKRVEINKDFSIPRGIYEIVCGNIEPRNHKEVRGARIAKEVLRRLNWDNGRRK